MKLRIVLGFLCVLLCFSYSCRGTSGYKVRKFLFDGVPPPQAEKPAQQPGAPLTPAQLRTTSSIHGPFAAKMCQGCHQPPSNQLVAPVDQLCYQCHDLRLTKKYVHGPIVSGGCLVCHYPHSSPYQYLLVSESDNFCFHCHDLNQIQKTPAHQGASLQCTNCHDAHQSDKKYLLK